MSRASRGAVAFVLAVAFGAVPLAADWCAVSCEAETSGAAIDAPPCHHSAPATTSMSSASACGHDHRGMVLIATATPSVANTFHFLSTTVASLVATVRPVITVSRAGPHRGPSTISIPLALSSTLRI